MRSSLVVPIAGTLVFYGVLIPLTSRAADTAPTDPAECAVILAAVMAGDPYLAGASPGGFPQPVRLVGAHDLKIADLGLRDQQLMRLGISSADLADLKTHPFPASEPPYEPHCVGSAAPAHVVEDIGVGHPMLVTMTSEFTHPVFSSDKRLALVQWSTFSDGYGHGTICAARKEGDEWKANCISKLD